METIIAPHDFGSPAVEPRRAPVTPVPFEVERAIPLAVEHARVGVVAHATTASWPERVNRALNFILAAIATAVLIPVFLAVALAVKLTSPGPILYAQTRVGLDRRSRRPAVPYDRRTRDLGGRIFRIYKFRSMRVDAESGSGAVWAVRNDPRVTSIGEFLRRSRLDELPQLFNVLGGDMNIVGPRPERPSIFAQLREEITEYHLRQRARPGITGWAQINQSYDACVADVRRKVSFDLEYIERRSVAHDLSIMLRTVPVMLFRRGGW